MEHYVLQALARDTSLGQNRIPLEIKKVLQEIAEPSQAQLAERGFLRSGDIVNNEIKSPRRDLERAT